MNDDFQKTLILTIFLSSNAYEKFIQYTLIQGLKNQTDWWYQSTVGLAQTS